MWVVAEAKEEGHAHQGPQKRSLSITIYHPLVPLRSWSIKTVFEDPMMSFPLTLTLLFLTSWSPFPKLNRQLQNILPSLTHADVKL